MKVEGDRLTVDPGSAAAVIPAWNAQWRNPKLRRWDQSDKGDISLSQGAVPVTEVAAADPGWINLEDGVQVQFAAGGEYRSGDYWRVPARVVTGAIEWPAEVGAGGTAVPVAVTPRGIVHHYAPLAYLS
ncbi:MAG: DUF6519 domain-containing protein, partial [Anaerolineales bacterium]